MGYREVELLGQNVNSFQGGCSLAELLDRVAEVDGLEWIRFTTSHPMNFTPALARTLAGNPKVAPFLHLPVQSGSDAVLKRMRREYTVAQDPSAWPTWAPAPPISACPRTSSGLPRRNRRRLRGHPGPAGAGALRHLLQLHLFAPARERPPCACRTTCHPVKQERLTRLQARQTELTLASNRRWWDARLPGPDGEPRPLDGGHWLARTASWKNVHLAAPEGRTLPFGELVEVRITGASPHFLRAELAEA